MRFGLLLYWLVVFVWPALALADQGYDAVVADALEAQAQGEFARSHALFEIAHRLSPNARTLRGMAVTSFQAGSFLSAVTEIDAALAHPVKPLDGELREGALALRAQAEAQLGRLTLRVEPPELSIVSLHVDQVASSLEAMPMLLAPGPHSVSVVVEGDLAQTQRLTIAKGAHHTLIVRFSPRPAAAPAPPASDETPVPASMTSPARPAQRVRSVLGWTSLALGAGAAATAVGVYVLGNARIREVRDACAAQPLGGCIPSDRAARLDALHLDRLERSVWGLTGVAIAAGVGAVGLFTWHAVERRRTQLALAPTGIIVSGRF